MTCWYDLYVMLNSFKSKDHMSELMDTFKVWKRPQFIVCLDGELNSELVSFLYVFKQGTLALEAFKKPTLHLVAFWRQKLLSHCEPIKETVMQEDDNGVEVELSWISMISSPLNDTFASRSCKSSSWNHSTSSRHCLIRDRSIAYIEWASTRLR